jgi:hypothetical protein
MERTAMRLAAGVLVLALAGCPDRAEKPQGQGAQAQVQQAPATSPAEPALPPPTPAPVAELPPPDPADTEGDLHDFRGFSRDETQFAYTHFAEAAGLHLLQVVEGKAELKHRFQLIDDAAVDQARAFLRERGFSRRQGELPPGVQQALQLRVAGGKARISLRRDGKDQVLYEADPFETPGAVGGVKSVSMGHVSPSGRRIAVRVEQVPVTEFGGIVGYLLLDVPQP